MNVFFPRFKLQLLPRMFGITILGAIAAGIYGILHDQITYSISPEYFTKLKFDQFRYVDYGYPERIFVSEIGFLATWWIGLIFGWFIARIAIPVWPATVAFRKCLTAFSIAISMSFFSGVIGFFLGIHDSSDYGDWQELCDSRGVIDVSKFVCVGYIHIASYIGGLIGLIAAMAYLVRAKKAHIQLTK